MRGSTRTNVSLLFSSYCGYSTQLHGYSIVDDLDDSQRYVMSPLVSLWSLRVFHKCHKDSNTSKILFREKKEDVVILLEVKMFYCIKYLLWYFPAAVLSDENYKSGNSGMQSERTNDISRDFHLTSGRSAFMGASVFDASVSSLCKYNILRHSPLFFYNLIQPKNNSHQLLHQNNLIWLSFI